MPAPKITTSVIDQSTRISSVGTYNTAIVIQAKKGPVNQAIKVTGQTDLLRKFTPDEKIELGSDTALYEAHTYLGMQGNLYVVRSAHTDLVEDDDEDRIVLYGGCEIKNSTSSNDNLSWTQGQASPEDFVAQNDDVMLIYGSSQGAFANEIDVEIITDQSIVKLEGAFIINVYKRGIKVESFTVSLDPAFKNGYGINCYAGTTLNTSNYIKGLVLTDKLVSQMITVYEVKRTITEGSKVSQSIVYTATSGEAGTAASATDCYETKYLIKKVTEKSGVTYSYVYSGRTLSIYPTPKARTRNNGANALYLTGGSDGSNTYIAGDKIKALHALENINDVNIQLIMDGDESSTAFKKACEDVCVKREDSCHAILSTPSTVEMGAESGDVVTDMKNFRNNELNINSANSELYTTHQQIYDEFNDRYVYISAGPFVAALIMKYANELGWHWAVAGYNRGIVNSLDVFKAYDPEIVDELSDLQINTIIKDPGYGNVIYDELTLLAKASDMQDAHIARYINIYLRPALKKALKPFLFEFNDEQTRMLITQMVETFMEPQKAARAVYDYKVVCDETNNLDSDIENNILNCWLYVKPTKIAKWIKQAIIVTPYSTNLEALEA